MDNGSIQVSDYFAGMSKRLVVRPPEIFYQTGTDMLAKHPDAAIHVIHDALLRQYSKWLKRTLVEALTDPVPKIPEENKATGIQNALANYNFAPAGLDWQSEIDANKITAGNWYSPEADPVTDLKAAYDKHKDQQQYLYYFAGSPIFASPMTKMAYEDAVKMQLQQDAPAVFPPQHTHPVPTLLEKAIPGFAQMCEPCPMEDCGDTGHRHENTQLKTTIIHLNDYHGWTREEIADWLDTLDHDLRFKTPEKEEDAA